MIRPSFSIRRLAPIAALLVAVLGGCSDDDEGRLEPTATPTILVGGEETPTSGVEATATEVPATPTAIRPDTPTVVHTSTPTIEVPGPDPTSTPTIDVPGPDPTSTPTEVQGPDCSASDSCSGSNTTLMAVSHSYTDPENTVLYRVTVPAASTGTSWGDGNNGFFYQVALSNDDDASETLTYVPFNGIGSGSDGRPELPQFWFIVPADESYTAMAVSLCASSYMADSGSTPACTASLWTDTYSPLPSPSVGDPPFGSVSLSIAGTDSTKVTVPNNGVYPGILTLKVTGSDLDDDDLDWLYDHLMFFDEDGNAYTNDLFADSSESHRSIGVLSIDEAAYQDPAESTYRTKYGSTDVIEKVDSPDLQLFFYTRDILGTSAIDVAIDYIYDEADDCRGYVSTVTSKDGCDAASAVASGTLGISPQVEISPETGQSGAIAAYPQNSIQAGEEENRTIAFELNTSSLCTKVTNPLAINVSGKAFNQPDYVIDDSSGTWGMSFPYGLYYVLPAGFGNCDSSTTPFCHLTSSYVAYVPHYADSNGAFGTLNGGSTTSSTIGSLGLADEYMLGDVGLGSSNSLVWFDNCGYGYVYEECSSCTYPLGTRQTLPSPPDDKSSSLYTVTNSLSFPIVFGKECCASYYQQNQNTGTYEPPVQLADGYGAFIPAGGSLSYETLFSDEATVVYNAATGEELFKLRLNVTSPAVYSCDLKDWSVTVGATAPYGIDITETGDGDLECGTVGDCPFGMTGVSDGDTVTCTATESSFLLGMADWIKEVPVLAMQLRAWGGSGHSGSSDACELHSGKGEGGSGGGSGFALTVQSITDLRSNLFAYVGKHGKDSEYGGSSTVLTTAPLSSATDSASDVDDPASIGTLLVAGGGGGGGPGLCDEDRNSASKESGGAGGAGGVAIANAESNADAVSAAGDAGGIGDSDSDPQDNGGNSDLLGSGASGAGDGVGGHGGGGTGWDTSAALVPPSSWSAGEGGKSNNAYGGGGFGGGGHAESSFVSDSGPGGGGGGSWATANTAYDSTAPIDALDSPNSDGGAVEIVYTRTFPCTIEEGTSGDVLRCEYTSSVESIGVSDLVDYVVDVTGGSAETMPVYVEAWGGRGGKGAEAACNGEAKGGGRGASGYARSSYTADALEDAFPALYLYVGAQGEDASGTDSGCAGSDPSCNGYGGGGGSASLVIAGSLEDVADGASPSDVGVLLIAGGGGGGGGGTKEDSFGQGCGPGGSGSDGGVATATTDEDVGGAGSGLTGGGSGVGGCNSLGGTCGNDGIGGLGGAAGSDTMTTTSWLGSDLVDWTSGAGAVGDLGGAGGGGWGGGQAGRDGDLEKIGGGGGGSYARMSTIDDTDAPVLGEDANPGAGDGSVVLTFDPCSADSTLDFCDLEE